MAQWIRARVRRAQDDARPESHRVSVDTIELDGEPLPTRDPWIARRAMLKPVLVFDSFAEQDAGRESSGVTLGLVPRVPVFVFGGGARLASQCRSDRQLRGGEFKAADVADGWLRPLGCSRRISTLSLERSLVCPHAPQGGIPNHHYRVIPRMSNELHTSNEGRDSGSQRASRTHAVHMRSDRRGPSSTGRARVRIPLRSIEFQKVTDESSAASRAWPHPSPTLLHRLLEQLAVWSPCRPAS